MNIEDDSSMFEIDSEDDDRYWFNVDELFALTHHQQPPSSLPQDMMIPLLQNQASRSTRDQNMKEYGNDDGAARTTQKHHPQITLLSQDQDSLGVEMTRL